VCFVVVLQKMLLNIRSFFFQWNEKGFFIVAGDGYIIICIILRKMS